MLGGPPDLSLLHSVVATLRAMKREEHIDLIWSGGARSGTDAAKLIALGVKAVVYNVPVALAVGGAIDGQSIEFASDRTRDKNTSGSSRGLLWRAGRYWAWRFHCHDNRHHPSPGRRLLKE